MKVIIRDYIKPLKESKELDQLIVNLLFHMNIEPVSRPQPGRQHGVDIMGVGIDPEDRVKKVFLISVKSGNLTRNNWNSGKNSIKPSLEEIFEVYIPTQIATEYKALPVKVVFALNGIIEQTAIQTWNGFKNKHSKTKKKKIVDWDIDKLTLLSEKYLFNESLLPQNALLLLRKSLAFIDINDYDLSHVSELFNLILSSYKSTKSKTTEKYKRLNLLDVCVNLLFAWGEQQGNIKNALFAAEKATLFAWQFILDENGTNDPKLIRQYIAISETLIRIQHAFGEKTIDFCRVRDSLHNVGRLNHVEYTLVCYEYMGILATIGLNYFYFAETLKLGTKNNILESVIKRSTKMVEGFSNSLVELFVNNPGCNYPVYDSHCIEINLVCLFLFKTGKLHEIEVWLQAIIATMEISYTQTKFFPLFYENYDSLVDAMVDGNKEKPTSSILLTIMAEWCAVINSERLYKRVLQFKNQLLPDVDLQLWYPDKDIEKTLFTQNSDRNWGKTKYNIKLYDDIKEYKKEMLVELGMPNLTPEPELEIFKNNVPFLGLLASRHYRTMVFPYYWRSL